MKSRKTAMRTMITLLCVVLVFHFLVLFEVISYEVVWGGRISSIQEMRVFEGVSILLNTFLIIILLIKAKNIRHNTKNKLVDSVIWIFVVLFALNTIGNLFSETWIELVAGTALTSLSSFLCWVIVRK